MSAFWAFAAAGLASALAMSLLLRASILDAPGAAQAQHKKPTPRAGGVGVLIGFALGALLARHFAIGPNDRFAIVMIAAIGFFALGLSDDLRSLGARTRLVWQCLLALFAIIGAGFWVDDLSWSVRQIGAPDAFIDVAALRLPLVMAIAGSALWVVAVVNAVNFIDGANGIAFTQSGLALLGLGAIATIGADGELASLAFAAAGAAGGFLLFNMRGRIFAGDCGALLIGAVYALLGLCVIDADLASAYAAVLLIMPMLSDVLLTLLWRARRRLALMQPHRDHWYQIALRAGLSHGQVTLLYTLWTAPAIGIAVLSAYLGSLVAVGGWIGYALLAIAVDARVRRAAQTPLTQPA